MSKQQVKIMFTFPLSIGRFSSSNYTQIKPSGAILHGYSSVYNALLVNSRSEYHSLYIRDSIFKYFSRNKERITLPLPVKPPIQSPIPKSKWKKLSKLIQLALNITEIHPASKYQCSQLAKSTTHQGILLDCAPCIVPVKSDFSTFSTGLFLDQLQDPHNVGSVLRSAYYFGIDHIFLSEENSCPMNSTVSRTSAGAMEHYIALKKISIIPDLSLSLQMQNLAKTHSIISTIVEKSKNTSSLESLSLNNYLLILGNEGHGIRPLLHQNATELIHIPKSHSNNFPLSNEIDSLNVSVTAGIILNKLATKSVKIK